MENTIDNNELDDIKIQLSENAEKNWIKIKNQIQVSKNLQII